MSLQLLFPVRAPQLFLAVMKRKEFFKEAKILVSFFNFRNWERTHMFEILLFYFSVAKLMLFQGCLLLIFPRLFKKKLKIIIKKMYLL